MNCSLGHGQERMVGREQPGRAEETVGRIRWELRGWEEALGLGERERDPVLRGHLFCLSLNVLE